MQKRYFLLFILRLMRSIQETFAVFRKRTESYSYVSVKNFQILKLFGPYVHLFGLNTDIYKINLRIQSENTNRNNSEFYAVNEAKIKLFPSGNRQKSIVDKISHECRV